MLKIKDVNRYSYTLSFMQEFLIDKIEELEQKYNLDKE